MQKYVLIVHSNPVPGREAEYNRWYTEQHLADVLKVPGFKSAQRYTLTSSAGESAWRYLAIYEFETDDPQATMDALMARAGTADMVLSQAMDMSDYSAIPWTAITEKMTRTEDEKQ